MSVRVDALREKLDALKSAANRAEQQAGDFGRMQEQISTLHASATSTDKTVTVTAGPSGSITDVQFSQGALRSSPSALSTTVMSTLREAVAEAARKQAAIIEEHVPDTDVRARVLSAQEELFGGTPMKSETAGQSEQHDDDDEGPASFMDRRGR